MANEDNNNYGYYINRITNTGGGQSGFDSDLKKHKDDYVAYNSGAGTPTYYVNKNTGETVSQEAFRATQSLGLSFDDRSFEKSFLNTDDITEEEKNTKTGMDFSNRVTEEDAKLIELKIEESKKVIREAKIEVERASALVHKEVEKNKILEQKVEDLNKQLEIKDSLLNDMKEENETLVKKNEKLKKEKANSKKKIDKLEKQIVELNEKLESIQQNINQ